MDKEKLKTHIKNMSEALEFLNQILEQETFIDKSEADQKRNLAEITELRLLVKNNFWPEAVSQDLICLEQNEDDKLARAAEVCRELFKSDLENKKILDFGCGEGHASYFLSTMSDASLVVGYDIEEQKWNFDSADNLKFTTKIEELKKNGPFDVILVHDVLDHCENPEKALSEIKSLKTSSGKIYLKCHPWTSRHATHLYKEINKAYLHLVFSENELYAMGIKPNFGFWCNDPLNYYKNLFKKYDLEVKAEKITTQPLELFFFTKHSVLKRIKNNLQIEGKLPTEILEIQFIDYLLY